MNWVQQEFDFDELRTGAEEKREKPALPYFNDPKNDNERLLNWQKEYREGDRKALDRMYLLGRQIARKYISVVAKRYPPVKRLSEDDKMMKAHNAITYMIERYVKVQDFFIKKSFTSYLYKRVQHELFYRRKVDGIVDFVNWEDFLNGGT